MAMILVNQKAFYPCSLVVPLHMIRDDNDDDNDDNKDNDNNDDKYNVNDNDISL